MNALRHTCIVSICVVSVAGSSMSPLAVYAQGGQDRYQSDSLVTAALEIMEQARYCALITLDESGRPHVRTMDPFVPGDDMVVWFGTHRRSRKVEQIRNDPRVAIHYLAPGGAGYVTIMGTARIVDDPTEKARRWKDEWEQLYSDSEADYVTIAVTPETLEVLDYSKGMMGDADTWKVPSVKFVSGQSGR